jgi:anaerobic selenocysteine-containing dehydrogenase
MIDMLLRVGRYGGKWRPFVGLSIAALLRSPHGIDLGPLQQDLPQGLWHKSKRIDLVPDFFFADLSRLEKTCFEAAATPAFPLRLIGRRHVRSNNSWLHNSERLVKGKNRCTLMIHPDDAQSLNINNGATVAVSSQVGRIEIEAEITDHIMQGVVSIPHGFGHGSDGVQLGVARKHAGVSVNELTDARVVDELCGNAVLNAVPVSVRCCGVASL